MFLSNSCFLRTSLNSVLECCVRELRRIQLGECICSSIVAIQATVNLTGCEDIGSRFKAQFSAPLTLTFCSRPDTKRRQR